MDGSGSVQIWFVYILSSSNKLMEMNHTPHNIVECDYMSMPQILAYCELTYYFHMMLLLVAWHSNYLNSPYRDWMEFMNDTYVF